MAESVVGLVIPKLASFLELEFGHLKNIHKEVTFIKSEFESIRALLKDVRGEEEQGEQLKTWLKDLRHVAFDIEDALDEYQLRHLGNYGFVAKTKYLLKNLMKRHDLATQIQEIKIQVQEISDRRQRYDSGSSEQVLTRASSSTSSTKGIRRDPRVDALLLEEAQVVGINKPRDQLISWLTEQPDPMLGVVAVFGPGGLGKTTLIRKVHESLKVRAHFRYHVWVTVSQTYDIKSLLREIIMQTLSEVEKATLLPEANSSEATKLKEMLQKRFRCRRYVVVLDDIWQIEAWRDIRSALPDSECGSRIIVTTRSQDIAFACVENPGYPYPLQPLEEDDAWSLFKKGAFKSFARNYDTDDQGIRVVSQKFLNKCKGLPFAIVAIAGYLSTKETVHWEQIYDGLSSLLHHDPQLVVVDTILSFSYNDLAYHLKCCLLYLSIFPDDYSIRCSRLLHLWVAEGFVDPETRFDMDSTRMTKEEVAKQYLDQLISRSLIQVGNFDSRKRPRTCKIHDLLHDFLRRKALNQEFAGIFGHADLYCRRLFINDTSSNDDVRENTSSRSSENSISRHVRSLFVFGGSSWFRCASFTILNRVKLLKVLDLEGAGLRAEIKLEAVTNLFFLRYLSLRGNSNVSSLPNSLERLINLETLDIKETSVCQLPLGIVKLKSLRHLLLGFGYNISLPVGIGNLTALEKLRYVHASKDVCKELAMLTRLRSLGVYVMDEDEATNMLPSIEKMQFLRSFDLYFGSLILDVQRLANPPPLLQRLYLTGLMNQSPMWILKLTSLVKLRLSGSRLKDTSFFDSLQLLPNLVALKLDTVFDGMELLWFKKGGFPRLRWLGFCNFPELKLIQVEEEALPCITEMVLLICPQLKEVPKGIELLTTLKKDKLSRSSDSIGGCDEKSLAGHWDYFSIHSSRWLPGILGRGKKPVSVFARKFQVQVLHFSSIIQSSPKPPVRTILFQEQLDGKYHIMRGIW